MYLEGDSMELFTALKNKKNIYEFKIIPLKSINGIEFGISRKDIWKQFGKPKMSFKKTNLSELETDNYEKFYIYYDENYNFEAIEIFDGIDIYYNNYKLPRKYSEILDYFKNLFNDIEDDNNGFISKNGSIGVYVENDSDRVDSILFGIKDYYN